MNFSTRNLNDLKKIIENIAREECKSLLNENGIESTLFGVIEGVNLDGTCNVKVVNDDSTYFNLLNKTGESLEIGNTVIIKSIRGDVGNGYIDIKCGENTPISDITEDAVISIIATYNLDDKANKSLQDNVFSNNNIFENNLIADTVDYSMNDAVYNSLMNESSGGTYGAGDYVWEIGEDDTWYWEKWQSGKAICRNKVALKTGTLTMNTATGYYYSDPVTLNLPEIFVDATASNRSIEKYTLCTYTALNISNYNYILNNTVQYRVIRAGNVTTSVSFNAEIIGRWC